MKDLAAVAGIVADGRRPSHAVRREAEEALVRKAIALHVVSQTSPDDAPARAPPVDMFFTTPTGPLEWLGTTASLACGLWLDAPLRHLTLIAHFEDVRLPTGRSSADDVRRAILDLSLIHI